MTTTGIDSDALVEDEWYAIRYSGEIPEVVFHSAIYHLTGDDQGPKLALSLQHHHYLVDAVRQRYIDIILRDLLPANRHTGGYRGVKRSLINWKRFVLFCEQYDLEEKQVKPVIGDALSEFLENELKEYTSNAKAGRLNCTWKELLEYIDLLGLEIAHLPAGSRDLCIEQGEGQPRRL